MHRGKRRVPFWVMVILIMTLAIGASVGTAALLIRHDTIESGRKDIQAQILQVAKTTAQLSEVKRVVTASNAGSTANLQQVMQPLNREQHTDFIVVLNNRLTRLSHPKANEVGKPFSSKVDPQPALKGHTHYSQKPGVLGPEYRVFYPVRDHGKVIGVVCVGITERNLHAQLARETRPILIGGLLGMLIGVICALLLSFYLRYLLLGMEPRDIAERTTRQTLIDNALPEGIIAIDPDGRILTANHAAQTIFQAPLAVGDLLNHDLKELLFTEGVMSETDQGGAPRTFNNKRLLVSANDLIVRHRVTGQVALVRDMSAISDLLDKLSGTEHYVSSLRAQTHEFMNQLQVIDGLLELEEYNRALSFIQQITDTYHQEVGHVADRIKWPALTGLILGKTKEAKEQRVQLVVDETSFVALPHVTSADEVLVLRIVSNLLDNAISASQGLINDRGKVSLHLQLAEQINRLTIMVTDNGTGISDDIRHAMFTEGFSTKGDHRGYGMGLIATAVKRLSGTMAIDPVSPHGTQITIQVSLGKEPTDENSNR